MPPYSLGSGANGSGRSRPPAGCAAGDRGYSIKSNVAKSGARIYRVPNDRFYHQTRMDTSRGERSPCAGARVGMAALAAVAHCTHAAPQESGATADNGTWV